MIKSKTFYLIIILIILISLLVIVQIFQAGRTEDSSTPQPPKQPQTIQQTKLQIIKTNISTKELTPTKRIKISFNKPVDNESLQINIDPQEEILPLFNQNVTELSIEPVNAWDYNTTYKITVLKATKSRDGLALDKDYEFSFKTVPYSGI